MPIFAEFFFQDFFKIFRIFEKVLEGSGNEKGE
jgi:hypothetical protein